MPYEDAKVYEGEYLTELKITGHLKRETIRKENEVVIVPGRNAITVSIEINDSFYCKSDIKKELEQIFIQILKNYNSKANNEKEEATSFHEFQNNLTAFGDMPLSHF